MRQLESLSRVHRSILSYAEQGRLVPKGEEFDRVMAVLDDVARDGLEAVLAREARSDADSPLVPSGAGEVQSPAPTT